MSNLRTPTESRDAGESSYQDHDSEYTHVRMPSETPSKETPVETPDMAPQEPDSLSRPASFNAPKRPRSLALAQAAANAVHSAWEAGYATGFSAGRLSGLDFAVAVTEVPTGTISKLSYDPGKNHDGTEKPF